jgi:nicotinamide riboside transporter PnuC
MNWTWILVGMGIAGVILNNYKRKECFLLWGITSACWCAVDWYHGIYSQAVLFAIYFLLAIHGWWNWRKVSM